MTLIGKLSAASASGSTIERRMYSGSFPPGGSSRFGPVMPVVPAGEKVWQPPQPLAAKSCLPASGSAVGSSAVVVGVSVSPVSVSPVSVETVVTPSCSSTFLGAGNVSGWSVVTSTAVKPRYVAPSAARRIV
jgi:hypothetical protein